MAKLLLERSRSPPLPPDLHGMPLEIIVDVLPNQTDSEPQPFGRVPSFDPKHFCRSALSEVESRPESEQKDQLHT